MRVAVLDDWQHIAETSADWSALNDRADVEFFHQPLGPADDVVEALEDFDILLAMRERTAFSPEIIARLPRLKFFNMTGRRARGLDAMVRRGITVSITGGGEDVKDTAEHALALMLSAVRRIPEGDASIKGGSFLENVQPSFRMAGRTLGILGLGLIGGHVANYCRAIGMNVTAWSRSITPEKAAAAGAEAVSVDELFSRSDIISVHLVLSPETTKFIGESELSRMRPGAILVNTSRAPLIDEPSLIEALHSRRIQAAIDVFNEEPLPVDHPLRSAPNVVLTPHVGYGTREMYQIFYRNSIENILAFLDGTPIRQYSPDRHSM
ncbi:D-2-hydroxyacid dehydrogenase family protein [Rhizobium laguerreae]|nr:D-2-hydroxyacid dehydrogenase family protein [Rhizobium laguerreae]